MKLAMSVGDNRHYLVDDVMPRHFLQMADRAGIRRAAVEALFAELTMIAPDAVNRVMSTLPLEFPEVIATQIVEGLQRRLKLIATA